MYRLQHIFLSFPHKHHGCGKLEMWLHGMRSNNYREALRMRKPAGNGGRGDVLENNLWNL